MRVLITGFPPFQGQMINPTQQVVDCLRGEGLSIDGIEIFAELVPVEYRGVEEAFDALIYDIQPDIVLSFGVGRHETTLRLESVGVNLDDASIPDNADELRSKSLILPSGPEEISSPLNFVKLYEALSGSGIQAEISRNAGRYICNHLLYYASYRQGQVDSLFQFLFTHVPTEENGFDLEITLKGIEVVLNWFQRNDGNLIAM
jgi:pyroglutamyl-peptidase